VEALEILEIDLTACEEMMCLVHQGVPGRTEANFILWQLLERAYYGDTDDLSRLCSAKIRASRMMIDRPGQGDRAVNQWRWERFSEPRQGISQFAPSAAPPSWNRNIRTDKRGNPIPPPDCWAPNPPPAAEAYVPTSGASSSGGNPPGPAPPAPPPPQLPGRGNRPVWV